MNRIKVTAGALLAAALTAVVPATAEAITPGRTSFQIMMGSQPVGTHAVTVTGNRAAATVRVTIDMAGRIGPVRFSYAHRCEETWRNGALASLSCTDRENDRTSSVTVQLAGAVLRIDGSAFDGEAPATTLPSSWWNAGVTSQTRLIDTRNGRLIRINATRVGTDTVAGASATRWRVRGAIDKDIWYDSAGRWVKSSFRIAGQPFEYRLTTPVAGAPRA